MPSSRAPWLVLPLLLSGCFLHQAPAPLPTARAERFEPIWEAVLHSYHTGGGPDAADRVARSIADSGGAPLAPGLGVFLETGRDSGLSAYRPEWVRHLTRDAVVDGVCGRDPRHRCGGAVLTSFVRLGDPAISGDTAVVSVVDRTEVPAECRRPDHGGFVGFHFRTMTLVFEEFGWGVVDARYDMTGSGFCGELPRAERAAMREDSLVRRRVSPIAGTWRFVIIFPEGDSVIIFARTPRRPGSTIRGHRLADVQRRADSNEMPPIDGYYLDGHCAFRVENLPHRFGSSADCQQAVTLAPVLVTHDSTVWRGESEADLAAWLLTDTTALGPRLRTALGGDDDRDPEWYFTPGFWVRHRDGGMSYHQEVGHAGVVLSRITGSRISTEVLEDD